MSSEQEVEVCDARDDAQGTEAGKQKDCFGSPHMMTKKSFLTSKRKVDKYNDEYN